MQPTNPPVALRPVYNAQEFATEILQGKRTARWVADQCRFQLIKVIKTAPHAPYMIPMSEAQRFMGQAVPHSRWSQ